MSERETRIGSAPWATVAFATGFGYFEAACVAYLRRLQDLGQLPITATAGDNPLLAIEMGREAVSLVLLVTLAWVAGRGSRERVGHLLLAFGIWDILYYVFLRVLIGWPTSLLDGDILFLIPVPWYGPVATPVLCSLVLVAAGWGTLALEHEGRRVRSSGLDLTLFAAGWVLVLASFLWNGGARSPDEVKFPWALFVVGWIAGAAGVARALSRASRD